jgi:hypothetical protein
LGEKTKDKKSFPCYRFGMTEKKLPSPLLQTLFVSKEASNCPLIAEMMRLGQKLEEMGCTEKEIGILSLDYGKRLLINAKNVDMKQMKQQDVVEIVDYDPLKNMMLVIGAKDPCVDTPVHWIVQKARHDINVLLQINSTRLLEKLQGSLPITVNETPPATLDRAKEILRTLREGRTILIKNEGVLFAGINIKEIENSLMKYVRGQK